MSSASGLSSASCGGGCSVEGAHGNGPGTVALRRGAGSQLGLGVSLWAQRRDTACTCILYTHSHTLTHKHTNTQTHTHTHTHTVSCDGFDTRSAGHGRPFFQRAAPRCGLRALSPGCGRTSIGWGVVLKGLALVATVKSATPIAPRCTSVSPPPYISAVSSSVTPLS